MRYYIRPEDVISTALAESMRRWGRGFVPYGTLELYMRVATAILSGGSPVVLAAFSKSDVREALGRCRGYFAEAEACGEDGIGAADGVTADAIEEKFRDRICPCVLDALTDARAVRELEPGNGLVSRERRAC